MMTVGAPAREDCRREATQVQGTYTVVWILWSVDFVVVDFVVCDLCGLLRRLQVVPIIRNPRPVLHP